MKPSDFRVLSFDCYGTLIDWESGLLTALAPLRTRASPSLGGDAVLAAFAAHESAQQADTPAMPYAALLAVVHGRLARQWGVREDRAENERFGASIGEWPAFPDTVAALRELARSHRLVILSNVDRDSFRATNRRLGVTFDAVHTAQDIGSYKPDPRNFLYLLDRLKEDGFGKGDLLHVAQSLFHDHVPANALGIASAWIDRRANAGGAAGDRSGNAIAEAAGNGTGVDIGGGSGNAAGEGIGNALGDAARDSIGGGNGNATAEAAGDALGDAAGWGATAPPPPGVRYDFRFRTLAELAAA